MKKQEMAVATAAQVAILRPEPATESVALIQLIERAAQNPQVDMDKMERLLLMHERLVAKSAETEFASALGRVQAKIGRISTDKDNPSTRSSYASYAAIDRVIRPLYSAEGFALSFDTAESAPETVKVIAYLSHPNGHTRTYSAVMPADGKGAKGNDVMTKTHAAGSAMRYGMRYLVNMIFNIAIGDDPHDDDGNGAGVTTITAAQAADLLALADEVGLDVARLLAWLKVERVEDLAAAHYQKAIAALESKRAK